MKWLLISLLGPEMVMAHASGQFTLAYTTNKQMQAILNTSEDIEAGVGLNGNITRETRASAQPLAKAPSGFLTFSMEHGEVEHGHSRKAADRGATWSIRHSFYADIGEFRLIDQAGRKDIIGSKHVVSLLRHKYIVVPSISTEDIKDRSKADSLAKTFACLQIGYPVLQCISRLIQHLGITTFELNTLSFAVCTGGTYAFWMCNPCDVTTPFTVQMSDHHVEDIDLNVE